MSDEIKKTENESPKAEPSAELPETALDEVTGGVTKLVDKASPILHELACTGKHIPTVTIE